MSFSFEATAVRSFRLWMLSTNLRLLFLLLHTPMPSGISCCNASQFLFTRVDCVFILFVTWSGGVDTWHWIGQAGKKRHNDMDHLVHAWAIGKSLSKARGGLVTLSHGMSKVKQGRGAGDAIEIPCLKVDFFLYKKPSNNCKHRGYRSDTQSNELLQAFSCSRSIFLDVNALHSYQLPSIAFRCR